MPSPALYSFRYKWDALDQPRRVGVMASEVIKAGYGDCVSEVTGLKVVNMDHLRQRLATDRLNAMARRANLEDLR